MKFYRTHVLVAQDTKSILAGSKRIEEALREEIKLAGLDNEIRVIPTGSLGYSENNQVAIAIYPDNIIYAPVLASSVKEIVEEKPEEDLYLEDIIKETPQEEPKSLYDYTETEDKEEPAKEILQTYKEAWVNKEVISKDAKYKGLMSRWKRRRLVSVMLLICNGYSRLPRRSDAGIKSLSDGTSITALSILLYEYGSGLKTER